MVLYFRMPFARDFLFSFHFYSETQDTQSADTEPVHCLFFFFVFFFTDDRIKCAACGVTTARHELIENRFMKPLTGGTGSGDGSASVEEKICTGTL